MPYRVLRDSALLFRLSRPINLFIALVVMVESIWLTADKSWIHLQDPATWGLIALCLMVMTAGYWVNDLYDYRIDLINKPERTLIPAKISAKKVWTAWFVFWGIVILAGLFFPFRIQLILQATWLMLFLYARVFKRKPVIGNLVVATLAAALVLISSAWLYSLSFTVLCLAVFSFEVTLLREITKDVEDLRGDMRYQLSTLPILIGMNATRNLLAWLYGAFLLSCMMPVVVDFVVFHKVNGLFIFLMLFLVVAPCISLIFLLGKASRPEDYGKMSTYLKALMLGGMLALLTL
jgi:4-hydroxybenzoate polyprenyltransferase